MMKLEWPRKVSRTSSDPSFASSMAAGTTRGFGKAEFEAIGHMIADVLDGLAANGPENNGTVEGDVRARVHALTARFPIYG